jgi:hypothetical protein
MTIIPTENRAYALAFFVVVVAAGLCGIVLFKVPGQWTYAMSYFKDLIIWLVPLVIGTKEVGKIGVAIANRGQTKPDDTTDNPPVVGTQP